MNASPKILDEKISPRQEFPPILKAGSSDPYYQEQFKALRAKLESRLESGGIKVVAISSAVASEGKTLSSVNLAVNISAAGRKKVLLVDADLRKSDLSLGLGLSLTNGLGGFLEGGRTINEILCKGFFPGLDIIPAGETLFDPSTTLGGEKIRSLLESTRERYDVIILDTPPILPVADTLSLRDLVDGFILLFRVQTTPYTMLKQALEELGNANILGVILNGVEPRRHKYYQKYYGKYYHRNTEDHEGI